jgi:alpha-L-fucosidase
MLHRSEKSLNRSSMAGKEMRTTALSLSCVIGMLVSSQADAAETLKNANDRTAWFAGRWGVFCHFLGNMPGERDTGMPSEAWNRRVDGFDAEGLAKQLEEVGASYYVITIGQGSGHYCAPNPVYDELTGIAPSKCSKRDLIADLHAALNPRGIRLLVYCAAEMSWGDEEARAGLGLNHHHNDVDDEGRRLGARVWREHRQPEFMRNIEKVLRAWSLCWGDKVAGWWVDGCYEPKARFPENDPPNFATLTEALRAGNPEAIVAFNSGIQVPIVSTTKHDDYTAGEIGDRFPESCPGAWIEKDGKNVRYHMLSYLGEYWASGDAPRFEDAVAVKRTTEVTNRGGFVSWDVPPQENGLIPEAFLRQLRAIGEAASK